MSSLVALALLAAASSGAQAVPAHSPTRAVATSRASVRILPGAKVSLSSLAETEGHKLTMATVTVEDGSRRPAKLVEFQ